MDAWFRLGMSAFTLGVETNQVIALRLMRLGSPAGDRELLRMIPEKVEALAAAGLLAAGSAARGESVPAAMERVVRSYRKRVRSNARRLKR
ncbi:MAG: hypothetical protein ABI399_12435 [Bauldia sp.]